uniref:Cilia and flagella associated protein 92 (putative) n=1 Tax=Latimeria chalumnae TaxID=7897 RepID=H3A4N6_LATCH
MPPYQSGGREHGTHVYFKDVNVILTGLFSASELQEYLRGPALEIEVHDRDRKIEHQPKKLGLFGTDPDDEKLSNVGLVTSKHTVHNPFGDQKKPWDPYGIAKVDLSELVLGEKCLNVSVPILSCPTPDSRGCYRDGKIAEFATSKDCPQTLPFSSGHYIESNSQIKLRIELPYGLPDKFQTTETETQDYHFSRIICILDYDNTKLSYSLLTEIIAINAEALHLKSYPKYVLEAALSSYKLKPEQKQSLELDIITGFHVLDGAIHLFVLEGLRNKSINRLWEKLQSRSVSYSEKGRLDILYNSDLCFHQRLYADLSVSLCHVCLHEPLSVIVRQPLLYVRDMVPHACFQALSKLDYICQIKKLKEAVQRKLFPSAKMIKLMSREFGVPISYDSIINQKVPPNSAKLPTEKMLPGYSKAKAAQPVIDTYNAKYTEWKQEVGDQMQDHIQNNIDAVHQLNRKLQRPKVETITGVPNDSEQVYNYSSQALNSTEQAKELLRREMAKNSGWTPLLLRFRYPGFKSSIESNEHPKMLNEMEIEELRKPWKENILHANILQPVLSRDRWNWNERHADFELYKKPPRFLNFLPPVTKHHAGNDLKPDQFETAHSNDPKCTDTPLVDDKMNVHRRATKTELCTEGSKASNQLDKLQGLLKDAPVKYSLKKPGLVLQSIPALSVMQQSVAEYSSGKVQDKKEVTQAFCPGLYDQHSLKWDKNVIPRYNMKHKMFEELKGANFKVYNCKNPFLYKREVVPLTKEERESTYLFQQSDPPFEPPHPTRNTQRPGNLIQTNTHCGLTFHIS